MTLPKGITANRDTRFGKPVISGTRVPVDVVVGKIAGGMTIDAVKTQYDLTKTQILAALKYAANIVASEDIALP